MLLSLISSTVVQSSHSFFDGLHGYDLLTVHWKMAWALTPRLGFLPRQIPAAVNHSHDVNGFRSDLIDDAVALEDERRMVYLISSDLKSLRL